MIARNIKSYITWIRGKEGVVSLYPDGIISWVDINKFILVDSMKSQESMWVIEEFLKSGVSELLVCELHKPIQYSSIRPTKNKRFSLEERWELVCSKASLSVSSWIIKARQQGYNRRTINVYKTI